MCSLDPASTPYFHPAVDLAAAGVGAVQRRIRHRVLRIAVRHGALTPDVAVDLAHWDHGGGFSLHAAVRIEAEDRDGLDRLGPALLTRSQLDEELQHLRIRANRR